MSASENALQSSYVGDAEGRWLCTNVNQQQMATLQVSQYTKEMASKPLHVATPISLNLLTASLKQTLDTKYHKTVNKYNENSLVSAETRNRMQET